MKWDYEGSFLQNFDANYTGAIGNIFCQAVRSGAEDVQEVLEYVRRDARHKLRSDYGSDSRNQNYQMLLHCLEDAEAYEFAEHILWRENLPADESRRLKEESRREGLNNFMSHQEPTEKQLSYLHSLGCREMPKSKLEASNLINQWLKKKAA